ncbi:class C sortase [Gleimia europaea]|uniref:Sortase n=1 Tax=Gleimia europaea ACS-120-V-Col10b TaxID=883069 RepID=A0A9W5RFA3_9ACTO|nr:class C sortase [Gleimia europaea]EPD31393.1 sortase [Gleimia europaea ACS-120-V-Col10b]
MLNSLLALPASLFYIFGITLTTIIALSVIRSRAAARQNVGTRNRKLQAYTAVLAVLALLAFSFPTVSQHLWSQSARQLAQYAQELDQEYETMFAAALAYNERLSPTAYRNVGDPAGSTPEVDAEYEEYEQLLSINGSSVMGGLNIPAIDVEIPIFHGTGASSLDQGAGHLFHTALPVGGPGTHSAVSAHAGMAGKRLFTDLDQLKEGDTWTVTVLNHNLTYRVIKREVVTPTNLQPLAPEPGRDLMSLITCTPTGINSHRLIITGERVD